LSSILSLSKQIGVKAESAIPIMGMVPPAYCKQSPLRARHHDERISQLHMDQEENRRHFADLSQELLDLRWRSSPIDATAMGIHDYDHTLGDFSADAFRSQARQFKAYLHALESEVNPALLNAEEELDYHLALSLASTDFITLERQRPWELNPSIYASTGAWGSFILLVREFAPLAHRVELMVGRMREVPDVLAVSKENVSNPPQVFTRVAIEVSEGALAFFRSVIPEVANRIPALHKELLEANETCISAFEAYRTWLAEELLPRSHGDFAIGSDTYQQLLSAKHGLTCGPGDLLRLGQCALDNVLEELEETAKQIDPSVTWHELVARLKHEHPAPDALLDAYRTAIQAAHTFVSERDLVTIPEGEELELRIMPEFERTTTPYAAYLPPAPFDVDQKGYFWLTPVDEGAGPEKQEAQLQGHCLHTIPVIALHEAYPGHHLQYSRSSMVGGPMRRQAMSNLFSEGWALYCEEMMREQGFYGDPRVRLFQLKDMVWRACRVLIDVGLHTGTMTFQEAVRTLVETARLEEVNAIAEVKRYAMMPTQPMTYVIGKLLVLQLREQMQRKLGPRFDLKRFHDRLLDYGTIPIPLVAQRMIQESERADSAAPLRRSA